MTVEKLGAEFLDNPFRTERAHEGNILTVEGKIASLGIDRDTGEPAIVFEHQDGGQSVRVKCLVSQDDPLLMEVSRGRSVAVQGTVAGFDDGVITMRDCKIVQ